MTSFKTYIMTKKESIEVTPAQKTLLELLSVKEVYDHFESLKMVHHLATYCVGSEKVDLSSSRDVHDLMDAIQKIAIEFKSLT